MRFVGGIIVGILLSVGANADEPQSHLPDFSPPKLAAMNWLPDDDQLPDRLAAPQKLDMARSGSTLIEVGRMAFRYRGLLGGWGARNGLSCHSCHQGTRTAPVFIPGVSDRPGRVDMTNALFSAAAEDGRINPKTIPPLSQTSARSDIKSYVSQKLTMLDALDTDPRIIEALSRYIAAVQSGNADKQLSSRRYASTTQKQVRMAFDSILRAASVIDKSVLAGDETILRFAVDATRAEMERVYERLDPADRARQRLVKWSTVLAAAADQPLDDAQKAQWPRTLSDCRSAMTALRDAIMTRADMTYYNRIWLKQALTPPAPPEPDSPAEQ